MKVWKLCIAMLFLLSPTYSAEDTVAEDIGVHQLERLVMLLTSKECEDLVVALSNTEENIFLRLERLSPENNQLAFKPLAKRDLFSAAETEAQCRTALTDWLEKYGEQIYYDRLTRALQHIGRTDVAIEVGKNINQDKSLSLKRYVEYYHKFVNSLNVPQAQSETKDNTRRRVRQIKARDLTWKDLDLIVERAPVPKYQKGPMDVILPVLYGILLGFGGTLIAGLSIFFMVVYISGGNSHLNQHRNSAV